MSKQKAPSIPEAPQFQSDPNFEKGINSLMGLGNRLTSFDFTGDLSPLAQTIELDPEVTRLALDYAKNSLTPEWNATLKNIRNEAANAGALESSTFTDALSQASQNLQSQYQSIVSGAALDDRARALQNRVDLFGTGLNTINTATGLAGSSQEQRNNFNLANYQNQVAYALSQQKDSGGLLGGLIGGAGGLMAGLALAPFTGGLSMLATGALTAGGTYLGATGDSKTGSSLLGAGSSLYGFGSGGGLSTSNPFIKPGSTAGALTTSTQQDKISTILDLLKQ